jgi:putative ABC transport system permease protein
VITLLLRISIPEFRKHLLRNVLTTVGIILGVAIFAAMRSANSSLKESLRDTIDQIAGKAVLQVTAGQAGVPESVADDVRSVTGVRAAAPVIEAVVRTTDASQGNILILGVDLAGDRSMRDYALEGNEDAVSDPLVFLAQPDSIMVSKEFAARNGLKEDSKIQLVTALGNKLFTVRGIMVPKGMAKAFGGNVGVMDIYSAQFVFSRGRTFDRVDIALDEGVRLDDGIARIQARLGGGYKIEPPLRRGKQTESLMEAYSGALFFSSAIAMTVGLFLIFNAFSVSVTQRRSQIGILRALGVARSQIQGLFLGESLILGIAGSLLGVLFGILMGRGVMTTMARVVEQSYGMPVSLDRMRYDPIWLGVSFLLGVAASLIGAWLPARAAGRVDPVLALQKGKYQVLFIGENRFRRWIGLILLLASLLVGSMPWADSLRVQAAVLAVLFSSLALLAPTFSHLLAGLLRRPMRSLFGMEGRLASDSLVQAPRRTSATVSALLFSLAFVLVMATFSVSVSAALARWIETSVNPDLFVSASESLTARVFQFPSSVGEALKGVPGVRQVDPVRLFNIEYDGRLPLLVSLPIDQFLRRSTPMMAEGRVEDLVPGMMGKNGVLISNNMARIYHLKRGSLIFLDTPTGRHKFDVVGVSVDYSSDSGSLLIDWGVYKQLWKDDRVDTFDLMIERGYDPDEVKREIQRRFAGSRNIFVLTNRDMRAELTRLTDQFLSLQYVQILLAVLVAVLGIINSLMVSITERKREFGILRGLGGERRQVRKTIVLEAVCIGLVAVLLGIGCGTILGYYSVGSFGAVFNGFVFPYVFPAAISMSLIPGVILISLLAAWYPSSMALKIPIVEALAYE